MFTIILVMQMLITTMVLLWIFHIMSNTRRVTIHNSYCESFKIKLRYKELYTLNSLRESYNMEIFDPRIIYDGKVVHVKLGIIGFYKHAYTQLSKSSKKGKLSRRDRKNVALSAIHSLALKDAEYDLVSDNDRIKVLDILTDIGRRC